MARFKTKITRARFRATAWPAERMQKIAQDLTDSIHERILRAENTEDFPAGPLTEKYGEAKKKYYKRNPIRDWFRTGRTMRSMKVLSAAPNKATIGFTDSTSNERAVRNNRRERQFGVSPRDMEVLMRSIKGIRFVVVEKTA